MIMRFALFRARARVARRKMIGDEEESTPSRARVSVYGMAAPPSSLASPATRGGGASRGGTLTRGPTQTQDASLAQEVRAETLSVRPASTVAAYGDVDDDADSGAGAAREWREWCRSRDGDTLHGVLIEDKPRAYDDMVRPEKVIFTRSFYSYPHTHPGKAPPRNPHARALTESTVTRRAKPDPKIRNTR